MKFCSSVTSVLTPCPEDHTFLLHKSLYLGKTAIHGIHIIRVIRGQVRFRVPALKSELDLAGPLQAYLQHQPGSTMVRVRLCWQLVMPCALSGACPPEGDQDTEKAIVPSRADTKGAMLCLIRRLNPGITLKSRVIFQAASGCAYTAAVGIRTP